MRLGEILVQSGKLSVAGVQEALEQQQAEKLQRRIGEILVEEGSVTEEDVLLALAEQFHMDCVLSVPDQILDAELVRELPVEWARAQCMLPVRIDDRLSVLTADPAQLSRIDDLALLLGADVIPVLAPVTQIERSIERCYFQRDDSAKAFIDDLEQAEQQEPGEQMDIRTAEDLLRNPDAAPITQLVNLILLEALKAGASDVHFEPFEDRLRVRCRIDGLLYDQSTPPKRLEASLISRLKVMGHLDIAEKRLPQDGMARVRVGEREVDIRISTIPVAEGERVVLRLLNLENVVRPLEQLGMPDTVYQPFKRLLEETNGAIWVTGPTGSGKTTTLYAALQELDSLHRNILTIEDPIEYQMSNIGQMAVKPKIGLTFARGLRHILRQDPDVILVGETRDLETAEIAIRAALTGHLVFSTLHTNDAAGAVIRLVDMGVPAYLTAAATRGAMAQRLVRVLCPACRKPAMLTPQQKKLLGPHADRFPDDTAWVPVGCPECRGGYRGRVGIYELLVLNDQLRDRIRGRAHGGDVRKHARTLGFKSMLFDGLEKARRGETSLEEVLKAVGQSPVEAA